MVSFRTIVEGNNPAGDVSEGVPGDPFYEDFLQEVIDVQWAAGGQTLPALIGDGAGLTLRNGPPDFSKALISVWFKVPAGSIQACADAAFAASEAAIDDPAPIYPPLKGIIPLVVWGNQNAEAEWFHLAFRNSGEYHFDYYGYNEISGYIFEFTQSFGTSTTAQYLSDDGPRTVDPSYLGIYCRTNTDEDGNPDGTYSTSLVLSVQMGDHGSGTGVYTLETFMLTSAKVLSSGSFQPGVTLDSAWDYLFNFCQTDGVVPGGTWKGFNTIQDNTEEGLGLGGPDIYQAPVGELSIEPDIWHHAIVSFDVGGSMTSIGGKILSYQGKQCSPTTTYDQDFVNTISGPNKVYLNMDGLNVSGAALNGFESSLGANGWASQISHSAVNSGVNAIGFSRAWDLTGLIREQSHKGFSDKGVYTSASGTTPSGQFEFGVPAPNSLASAIFEVEMAVFQFFTGIAPDVNRVRPLFVTANGTPQDPKVAKKVLGNPKILLAKSADWAAGRNTGSYGAQFRVEFPVLVRTPIPQIGSSVG